MRMGWCAGRAGVERDPARYACMDLEFHGVDRLGSSAKEAIAGADAVFVSLINVYEVTRKARLGRCPPIASGFQIRAPPHMEQRWCGGMCAMPSPVSCARRGAMDGQERRVPRSVRRSVAVFRQYALQSCAVLADAPGTTIAGCRPIRVVSAASSFGRMRSVAQRRWMLCDDARSLTRSTW